MCVESLLASGGIRFAVRPFARPGVVASPSETLQCRRARNRRACQWVWACCCMRGTPCPMETAFQTTASVERPAVLGAKRTTGEFRSWRVDSPFGWQLPSQTSGLKHLHQAHQTQGSAVHKPSAASGLLQQLPPESQGHTRFRRMGNSSEAASADSALNSASSAPVSSSFHHQLRKRPWSCSCSRDSYGCRI